MGDLKGKAKVWNRSSFNPNGAVGLYRRVQILIDKGFTEFISL